MPARCWVENPTNPVIMIIECHVFELNTKNPEIFCDTFFSRITLKDIFVTSKILQLVHDLSISVNDILISPFRKEFIFTKLRLCEVSRK